MNQEIRFCSTSDGVNIAYASAGSGPPLVKAANWMNHLEHDWKSPVWRHLMSEFSRDQHLLRYDERGTGLSDRDVGEFSLDAFVDDLTAVVDSAGLEQFPLLAISQGGPVAIAFAAKYPERVSHLVILGSFAAGWKRVDLSEGDLAKRKAEATLIREGWHSKNPAIRQMWTTASIPDGNTEAAESFNELQRISVSPESAARIFETIGEMDVTPLLPEIKAPVLVLHSRGDSVVPFEEGRKLASLIPGAKFVPLESRNHLLLSQEPAWPRFVSEVRSFLGRPAAPVEVDGSAGTAKRCAVCRRQYLDESLNFCLDDGTPLSTGRPGDEETKILYP
jgi:pimeloyl-ACP methyl ester carboxylesterase